MFICFTGIVFILPFEGILSPDLDTSSCIQNKNGKRSFFGTSENNITDNDIYRKL